MIRYYDKGFLFYFVSYFGSYYNFLVEAFKVSIRSAGWTGISYM